MATVLNARLLKLALCSGASLVATLALAPAAASAQAQNTGKTQSSSPTVESVTQSDASSIEEVVVTARKREERLRDIPTAGTALGADLIREIGGVASAQSLLSNTPGVNFANTSNPTTSEVSIRGSGTSRATTAESGVGLFRDGAYIGGGTVLGRTYTDLDLFDAERIEVLRGVQGGLNGRNAEGGAVNVVTARPSSKSEGYIFATVGNLNKYEVQGAINIPLDDHWAVRFSVDELSQPGGFYYLPLLSRYADQQFRDFFRGQLNYKNGRFQANLLYEHGAEELPGLVYQVTAFPSAIYPNGYTQDRYNLPWNSPSEAKMQLNNYELTTSTDLGFADLVTTSMYRERNGENAYDRDALSIQYIESLIAAGQVAPASIASQRAGDYFLGGNQTDRAKIFYNDVHLTGAKVGGFTWVAGTDYYLLRDRPKSVLGRTPTAANGQSPGTIDVANERFESVAGYGSAGYDFTSKLNLAADLRVTNNTEDFISQRLDLRTALPASAFNIAGSTDATNVSYTVTGSWKPMRDWLLYAKIGSAFRPGGFNTSLGDVRQPIPVPSTYADETVTAYEVGFKGNLMRNLYVAMSLYDNEFDNLIIQGDNGCFVGSPVCPVQATSFAFNAGPASLYGFELEATSRFQVFGGPLRLTGGFSNQGGEVTSGIYKGRRQPQQPDYTMTFNANYRHAIAWGATAFANVKGSGRWGGVQEVAQTPLLQDFVMVDARAGIEVGHAEFAFYANNLFDENYYVFGAINAVNQVLRYNLPRTYGIQMRYTF